MKKLILSLTLAAFAMTPTLFAGDAQPQCPFAKAGGDKKACCAAQAKAGTCPKAAQVGTCPNQAKKGCCPNAAKAKVAKKAMSPKGAQMAQN